MQFPSVSFVATMTVTDHIIWPIKQFTAERRIECPSSRITDTGCQLNCIGYDGCFPNTDAGDK